MSNEDPLKLVLYHVPQSRSMRTLWLLHELAVPFDVVTVPFDKSLRDTAFLARSPAGRVPALEIDGTPMFETGAMTEVLCEMLSPVALGRSAGHPERRDWLMWVHFAETLSQHVATLTQQHVMLYEDHMRSPTVMKLEAARVGKCLDAIEARLRETGAMLVQSGFSAADVSVGQAVYMARHFRNLDAHPKVAAWYDAISARAAFQSSLPAEGEARLYARAFYDAWKTDAHRA